MVNNQEISIIVLTVAIIIVTIIVESEEACYVRTSTEKVVTGSWDEGGWRLDTFCKWAFASVVNIVIVVIIIATFVIVIVIIDWLEKGMVEFFVH